MERVILYSITVLGFKVVVVFIKRVFLERFGRRVGPRDIRYLDVEVYNKKSPLPHMFIILGFQSCDDGMLGGGLVAKLLASTSFNVRHLYGIRSWKLNNLVSFFS